jgi:DNA-binding NarL/FixJ family response regulator
MINQTMNGDGGAVSVPIAQGCIRVLLVDDHPAVRVGIRKLIDDQPDMIVVGEASSATEGMGDPRSVDVAILDYHLDGRNGLWLTRRLKELERPPRVLIYSAFADGALAVAAIVAGADGLLSKGSLGDELCATVRNLARGRQSLPAITPSIAQALRSQLAPRDQAIFGMLLHGIEPGEIATALAISRPELDARRSNMLHPLASTIHGTRPSGGARAPLDYERSRRAPRYRAT